MRPFSVQPGEVQREGGVLAFFDILIMKIGGVAKKRDAPPAGVSGGRDHLASVVDGEPIGVFGDPPGEGGGRRGRVFYGRVFLLSAGGVAVVDLVANYRNILRPYGRIRVARQVRAEISNTETRKQRPGRFI